MLKYLEDYVVIILLTLSLFVFVNSLEYLDLFNDDDHLMIFLMLEFPLMLMLCIRLIKLLIFMKHIYR